LALRPITLFVVLGVLVALGFAFFVSPLASSSPDGLERVAIDHGFESQAAPHVMADAPLADYGVAGVHNSWLSTGLSGVIGVLLCFALAGALVFVIRRTRRRGAAA
jgi:cobalt/nickel transport system permease protein/cobalt/nickel transport protein